ncbi:hypothetical protein [Roseisolibacter agri]|uniref:Uncharacterized protein n=1 Tax=Roseisolibacter agri TaxID=2014610 RepID=A0AA37QKB7_9BACT|nr:hypothetical protein [Roseisolibacter agri]GLC28110.1 hypothetical protein rosag_46230 [Roseisolibacter agri]
MTTPSDGTPAPGDTVADVAGLYLGNILYALELAALSLEEQGKREDAAFYRGIARRLAEARGRETGGPPR